MSPALALVLAGLLLTLGVLVPALARRAGRRPAVEVATADAEFGSDVLDLVRGLADHASGDGGTTALRSLGAHLDRQAAAERAGARVTAATTFLRDAVPGFGVVAALWLVGRDVAVGATNPVLLAASALGVLGAFEAVGGLGAAWGASAGIRAPRGGCGSWAGNGQRWPTRPNLGRSPRTRPAVRRGHADPFRFRRRRPLGVRPRRARRREGRPGRAERRGQEQRPRARPALA